MLLCLYLLLCLDSVLLHNHFHDPPSAHAVAVYSLIVQAVHIDDTLPTGHRDGMIQTEHLDDVIVPRRVLPVVEVQVQLPVVNAVRSSLTILQQHHDQIRRRCQRFHDQLLDFLFS